MAVLLKTSDLQSTGWTPALIKSLLGDPDEKEPSKRGPYNTTRYWWLQERVRAAMLLPAYLEAQARKETRLAAPERKRAAFQRKFQTWRVALPDACHGLHSLNRLCKHASCSTANKSEIYDIKNRMVELLYRTGYCTACWQHILVLPPKPCWDCGGGRPVDDDYCDKCGGTGIYLHEKRLTFYCFRFQIGRGYCWHQPDSLVTFPVTTTAPPAGWTGVEREKPLEMPVSALATAKELLRWVLDRANEPEPEFHFSEHPLPPIVNADQQSLFA